MFFSDLKVGKCSSIVEARLLRFWEARNVKRDGELMWVDLFLVDVNVSSFPGLYLFSILIFAAKFHLFINVGIPFFIFLYSDLCS